jgi:hypothetical protein
MLLLCIFVSIIIAVLLVVRVSQLSKKLNNLTEEVHRHYITSTYLSNVLDEQEYEKIDISTSRNV